MDENIICPGDGHWIGCNFPFAYKGYWIDMYKFDRNKIMIQKENWMKLFGTVEEAEQYIDDLKGEN